MASALIPRREALRRLGVAALAPMALPPGLATALAAGAVSQSPITPLDARLLADLERSATTFFLEAAHPETGLVLDRRRADGRAEARTAASIAATGFGLSVLCLARERGYLSRSRSRERVARTLRWLRHHQPHEHGFYFHFLHWGTGERIWECELSSVDSALLLCGVLHARACFPADLEIQTLATELYERVDWPWFLNGRETLSMGWRPGAGFLKSHWDHYSELMLIYLLGLGSPTHPLPSGSWRAWSRPERTLEGERFIWSPAPLFAHQFSHAWFDFRGRSDSGVDWFGNSVAATRAHLKWSLRNRDRFPRWSEDFWGVTASDSRQGYVSWGGPPESGPIDGTLVPCAAAGSLPFLPRECLRTLHHQRRAGGEQAVWTRYGFVDAWNPQTGWVNPDVVGIDVGISALMAANLRDGFVWRTFQHDPAAQRGFERAGVGRA